MTLLKLGGLLTSPKFEMEEMMMTSKIQFIERRHQQIGQMMLMLIILTVLQISNLHAEEKPYPGELYDIGTHRLHMNCVGNGAPTVIIDSGAGGFSLEWINIQNNLAEHTRVCSYDRAGLGFSDPGPMPRTTAQIVFELKRLLDEANIHGPYVLVGHSFGGYNIRYFASLYPELVSGMVLVDASHPQQFNTEEFKRHQRKKKLKFGNLFPVVSANFPEQYRHIAYLLMGSMKSKITVMNELDNMHHSAEQLLDYVEFKSFDFPVVVLTRGKRVFPHTEMGDRREARWTYLQDDLENVSTQTWHRIAKQSGHIVHLDEPEVVSSNILFAVNRAIDYAHHKEMIAKYDTRVSQIEEIKPVYNLRFNLDETEYLPFAIINSQPEIPRRTDFLLPEPLNTEHLHF
ncbi:MAG: alpha/beta hydrolase [Pseudomonadota bacterium]